MDPAIELLGAVDLLGEGSNAALTAPDRDYVRALERACAPFRTHPAVTLNARMHKSDRDYFQRKDLLLLRSAPPKLEFDKAMSSCRGETERSGAWEPWLAAMRDFARQSRFLKVFGETVRFLKPGLEGLRERVAKADYFGKIERYTGLPFHGRYRLIVSPLCARGASLTRIYTRDDGRLEIVSILRTFTDNGLDAVVWHELGHGVMDMTADLYDHEQKDTPIALGPECSNWLHGMREHLVRAVMIRLIALERSEAAATRQFLAEEFSRRPPFAAFLDRLRKYEASRGKYPTLADFYPRLRQVFPPPSASAKPKPAGDCGQNSWPDLLRSLVGPFYTQRQRSLAVAHLDLMLARSRDKRLLLRRAVLNYLMETQPRSIF